LGHHVRVDVIGHGHVVEDCATATFLGSATDFSAGGGDVIDRHVPSVNTVCLQRSNHPTIQIFIGLFVAQSGNKRLRRIQGIGDAAAALHKHCTATRHASHHGHTMFINVFLVAFTDI